MDGSVAFERTPAGRRLVVSRRVDAPAAVVWELLADTRQWPEWGPSVAAVECEERIVRTGTRGRIRTTDLADLLPGTDSRPLANRVFGGVWLPFRVTDCGGRRWTWRVADIPATGHRVEGMDEGCRVAFEVPLPAAAYAPVCGRALDRIERLATEDSD